MTITDSPASPPPPPAPDLKDDNVQLKNENQSLREYIDKLLLNIIATSPSILEIKNSLATSRGDACHPSNNGSFVQ